MFSLGIQFAPISRVKEYKRRANNFEKGRQREKKNKEGERREREREIYFGTRFRSQSFHLEHFPLGNQNGRRFTG